MSDILETRLRSHQTYISNQLIHDNNLGYSDDIIRERAPLKNNHDESIDNDAQVDYIKQDSRIHDDRCITPARGEILANLNCAICLWPAINPMRCTRPNERNSDLDFHTKYSNVYHIVCYQCISNHMLVNGLDVSLCPICRTNIFDSNNFMSVNNETIIAAKNLCIDCANGCGLSGSPIAMANHICYLAKPEHIGHTVRSKLLDTMAAELEVYRQQTQELEAIKQMNSQLVAKHLHIMRTNEKLFEDKQRLRTELRDIKEKTNTIKVEKLTEQFNEMTKSLNEKDLIIASLGRMLAERERKILELVEENSEMSHGIEVYNQFMAQLKHQRKCAEKRDEERRMNRLVGGKQVILKLAPDSHDTGKIKQVSVRW